MLLLSVMRREAARQVLSELARAIAFDSDPTKRTRTRRQHLRNGVGSLLGASSQVVFRPGAMAVMYYATRARARAQLRYGILELARAGAPATQRQRIVFVAVPSVAVGVALALRARRKTEDVEPVASEAEPVVSPEPVAAGVAE